MRNRRVYCYRFFGLLAIPCCLAPCGAFAATLGAAAITVGSAAGSSSVLVTDTLAWTATANNSFLHVSGGSAAGTGNALVLFTIDAFAGGGTRTGTLTIGGLNLAVTQLGPGFITVNSPSDALKDSGIGTSSAVGVAVDSSGTVYVADQTGNSIHGWNSSTENTSFVSGLSSPSAVAVDGNFNLYIADSGSNSIKKWTTSTQTLTTLVSGLNAPGGVAVDGAGNVYIADTGNNAIKKWSKGSTTTLLAGLSGPHAVAVDANGNVYAADTGNNMIREWVAATGQPVILVSTGLTKPDGVAVDGSGNVYFSSDASGSGGILKWNASTHDVTSLASSVSSSPRQVAVDGFGNIYFADSAANKITEITPLFETLGATSLAVGSAAGSSSLQLGFFPFDLFTSWTASTASSWLHLGIGGVAGGSLSGAGGSIIVFALDANTGTSARSGIIDFTSGLALTVTQEGTSSPAANVLSTLVSGLTNGAYGTAVDSSGNVYFASGTTIQEWIAATRETTVLVASGVQASGLAVDGSGNVYIADTRNNEIKVWTAATRQVTTLVSSGLNGPRGVALDGSGNVYIADTGNNQVLEWNAATHQVSILVRSTDTIGGLGESTTLNQPYGVAVDLSGNVWIADYGNHAVEVWSRLLEQIEVKASSGLTNPWALAVDGSGSVYIADWTGSAIYKWSPVTALGVLTKMLSSTDGLSFTAGVAVDGAGNLYFADSGNGLVRKFTYAFGGSQTITFGALSSRTFGAAAFTIGATASSGLVVSFASITLPVCTISGATVTLVAAGTCTIQATQVGNSTHVAATPVNQSFIIGKGSQTIAFGALTNRSMGNGLTFLVSATATSGLTVSFDSTTTAVCSVSGAMGTTATLAAAGTCTIEARQAGNADYNSAEVVSWSFTVSQASQTIAFGALSNRALDTMSFTLSATSSSGLAVTFVSATASICSVTGTKVTLAFTGTCSIKASQAGNSTFAAAVAMIQDFTVTGNGAQTIAFGVLSNRTLGAAPFALSAIASSALTVTFTSNSTSVCTVSGVTATLAAAGTCSITASQGGNSTWAPALSVTRTFTVDKAQTIAFGALGNRAWGSGAFALSATASSGLTVAFVSNTVPVCSVSGSVVALVTKGTCTIAASQAGNAEYAAAPAVTQTFTVTGNQFQTITFAALSVRVLGTGPVALSAAASSGLAVAFASNTGLVCKVSGMNVTLVTVGTCSITASQAGNATWAAATPVTRTFMVSGKAQTITFGTLVNRTMGPDSPGPLELNATASSGLTVTFASNSALVCTVSGGDVTLAGAGICSITASQPGNAVWAPAPQVTQTFVVNKAQTITFGAMSNRALGTAPYALIATASSGLAVTFVSHSATVCTVSGSTVTLIAPGACTISAGQSGNSTWAAATEAFETFTVTGGKIQTITFANPGGETVGVNPALVATASSGLAITFTSNSTSICTVGVDPGAFSGFDATLIAAGACTITASQAGNANFSAAVPISRSFQVVKGQTIVFPNPGEQVAGTGLVLVATTGSGLPITFTSNSTSICTVGVDWAAVSGSEVTLIAAGTCSITASQAGNAIWPAATAVTQIFAVFTGIPQRPVNPSPGTAASPGPTTSGSTVILSWSPSSGATYYGLGLVDVATGVAQVVYTDKTDGASYYTWALAAGTPYRWTVAACNVDGCSPSTSVLYFQTPACLLAFPLCN